MTQSDRTQCSMAKLPFVTECDLNQTYVCLSVKFCVFRYLFCVCVIQTIFHEKTHFFVYSIKSLLFCQKKIHIRDSKHLESFSEAIILFFLFNNSHFLSFVFVLHFFSFDIFRFFQLQNRSGNMNLNGK